LETFQRFSSRRFAGHIFHSISCFYLQNQNTIFSSGEISEKRKDIIVIRGQVIEEMPLDVGRRHVSIISEEKLFD